MQAHFHPLPHPLPPLRTFVLVRYHLPALRRPKPNYPQSGNFIPPLTRLSSSAQTQTAAIMSLFSIEAIKRRKELEPERKESEKRAGGGSRRLNGQLLCCEIVRFFFPVRTKGGNDQEILMLSCRRSCTAAALSSFFLAGQKPQMGVEGARRTRTHWG